MEQRHSPCRDTSSWTDSNDFDEREREVADILVEFYHQLNEYARPQVSVWGAKRKRSVLDETYSPAQAATFPNNSEPLRVQPLRSVPSNSYTNTTMKINDECLRAQPLRTVIPSNDGLFSTGATNLVCHREPNSLVLHLKPMKKLTNKKVFRLLFFFYCFFFFFYSDLLDLEGVNLILRQILILVWFVYYQSR